MKVVCRSNLMALEMRERCRQGSRDFIDGNERAMDDMVVRLEN